MSFSTKHEHTLRVFLPLGGWPFLVQCVHRKLEVSLFMSVEKTRPQSFWLLSAGPYLTPLCYQESRTEALTVHFLLCSLCFLGPQTGHSIGLALLGVHMDRVDPPCKNINTFLSNLEQIGFSYLLMGFMVPQGSQSCVPFRVMEGTDNA